MPITERQVAPNSIQDNVPLAPNIPEVPPELLERFPSLVDWNEARKRWWTRNFVALQTFASGVGDGLDEVEKFSGDLYVSFNQFKASVTTELEAIADEFGAVARRIVTVSAMAGITQSIKVQTTAPMAPALNDYWIDNSDITEPVTYQWDGASWVEVTEPIAFAGVADERSARVTADGFLEGKYTLTVVAGDVVTGMNITSASGPGGNVSSVTFQADRFQIYTSSGNKQIFSATATEVKLGNVLTVDLSASKVYIGTGTFANSNTPFYVDNGGNFSLGNKLSWNGTTLTIVGGIVATSGTIGGWNIAATTLSNNNAVLDSAGQLVLGTSNDVVILSATDATYRVWIGNATAGSALFRVTKTGIMTSLASIIGGTGSNGDYVLISSSGLQVGANTSQAVFYVNNNGGNARLNMRYNGNIVLTANAVDLGGGVSHGVIQLSRSNGTGSNLIDGGSITIINTATSPLLSLASGSGSLIFNSSGLLQLTGSMTASGSITASGGFDT